MIMEPREYLWKQAPTFYNQEGPLHPRNLYYLPKAMDAYGFDQEVMESETMPTTRPTEAALQLMDM